MRSAKRSALSLSKPSNLATGIDRSPPLHVLPRDSRPDEIRLHQSCYAGDPAQDQLLDMAIRGDSRKTDARLMQIGSAHVCTPVTNAHLVCRLLLDKTQHNHTNDTYTRTPTN